jgi:hypothetical protein
MANLKPRPEPDGARNADASLRNPSPNADVDLSLSLNVEDVDDPRNPRDASMVARRPRGKDVRRREVVRESTSSMLTMTIRRSSKL